ncbi:MAG: restriction endonuclease subunit S [Saprospiraceae bacterium]|nr:restriction endonuclease subunit S [Saprospiraceae bacterium]
MEKNQSEEYSLKDLCSFQEGYVNPSQEYAKYFDGNVKWLRANDVNGGFILNTSRTLTEEGFNSAGTSALLFNPQTIVITKSGTIGRLGILCDYMCGNRAVINIKHPLCD